MRALLVLLALLILPGVAMSQSFEKYRVYIGNYANKKERGIDRSDLNMQGVLAEPKLAVETKDPSFLAIHPSEKFLYAVNEGTASVSAFAIDPATGDLTYLNSQPSGGGAPCHLIVDAAGKHVLAANYTGGSCICLPIEADGKLGQATSFHQHKGAKKPHGHSIHLDRANKFAFCVDLGLDQVLVYRYDTDKGTLTPHDPPALQLPPGCGPRHFAWHPDGKHAYVNGESDMTINACEYDAEKGILTKKQTLPTLPQDAKRKGVSTAEVVVHPSGKFVYVSNRGHNSIAIFAIDPITFELKAVGHEARDIATPRNFAIEPSGQFLLVANQSAGTVKAFRIDQSTGELTPTGSTISGLPAPVCVRFLALPK